MNTGVNRVWYKSTGFRENLIVEVQFLYPNLSKSTVLRLVDTGDGLYYVDFDFMTTGDYVATFFEDNKKSVFKLYNISNYGFPGIVTKK